MNFNNLLMWAIIIFLSEGFFNMFQEPQKINSNIQSIAREKRYQLLFLENLLYQRLDLLGKKDYQPPSKLNLKHFLLGLDNLLLNFPNL